MKRRREYLKATSLDAAAANIRIFPAKVGNGKESSRSLEVIDLVIRMIELASKRGPVKQYDEEVIHEAA